MYYGSWCKVWPVLFFLHQEVAEKEAIQYQDLSKVCKIFSFYHQLSFIHYEDVIFFSILAFEVVWVETMMLSSWF